VLRSHTETTTTLNAATRPQENNCPSTFELVTLLRSLHSHAQDVRNSIQPLKLGISNWHHDKRGPA